MSPPRSNRPLIAPTIATAIRDRRRAWNELAPAARATTIMLGLMVVAGVALRVWDLGAFSRLAFDEHHFVPNARRYLLGESDENDHPPLGKLFIAVGILLFGDNATGWRAASLIMGLQTLVIAGALARELFADRRAGWFAAAFLAADGFFISYSRTALLDAGLTCLVLWSMLAAVTAQTWRGVLASAIGAGLASSVKWSGAFVVIPAAVALLMLGRAPRWSLLLFAVAPVIHVAIWLAAFAICDHPVGLWAVGTRIRELAAHHIEVGRLPHYLASPWYSWPVLYRPILLRIADHGTRHRYSTSAGNPLLYASATLAVLLAALGGLAATFHPRIRAWVHRRLGTSGARAVILLVAGWIGLLAPWIVGRGVGTYIYHYLPSYGFALTLVAGGAAFLERRFPRSVAIYVALTFALMIYFAPVWAGIPISESMAYRRLIFETWRP